MRRWIADLDAADPAVRDGATDALADHAGPAARPAVIAALPAASPEAAGRLADVLLRTLAWDAPARPTRPSAGVRRTPSCARRAGARVARCRRPAAADAWSAC